MRSASRALAAGLLWFAAGLEAQGPAERKPDVHFVVTRQPVVDEMLRLARVRRTDVVYDLGSGDGRIVITAAARYGARGVGVELDTQLINLANRKAREAGVSRRVRFLHQDLFATDLSSATVVTIYLGRVLHQQLRPVLYRQLRPGARIIAHGWELGEWTPDARTEADGRKIFFWVVPAKAAGRWRWRAGDGSSNTLALEQHYQRLSGRWVAGTDTMTIATGRLAGDSLFLRAAGCGAVVRLQGRVRGDVIGGTITRNGRVEPWAARRIN